MTATYEHVHILHKLTTEFYQQVRLPYVQRFIPEPIMDPMQAKLLLTMLEDAEVRSSSQHAITLAALLVQAAMDTHDRIGTAEVSSESERKQRQLTVLAGDYYSSLYYRLLAGAGEAVFIKVMSNAVENINNAKMRALNTADSEETLTQLINTKSAITTHIAEYLGFKNAVLPLRQLYLIQLITQSDKEIFDKFSVSRKVISGADKINKALHPIRQLEHSNDRILRVIFEEAAKKTPASL